MKDGLFFGDIKWHQTICMKCPEIWSFKLATILLIWKFKIGSKAGLMANKKCLITSELAKCKAISEIAKCKAIPETAKCKAILEIANCKAMWKNAKCKAILEIAKCKAMWENATCKAMAEGTHGAIVQKEAKMLSERF